jgi:O-antigen biosynthesis protein
VAKRLLATALLERPSIAPRAVRLTPEGGPCSRKLFVLAMATQSAHLLNALLRVTAFFRKSSKLRRAARRLRGWRLAALLGRPPASKSAAAQFAHIVALAAEAERDAEPLAPVGAVPLISFVVPVFNTRPRHLDDLLASFRAQAPMLCELVLSDDGSKSSETAQWLGDHQHQAGVVIVKNAENRGIASATNAGLAHASGVWIGLLDHDDALAPFAVSRIARALAKAPQCRFLYTDELVVDASLNPVEFFLKPAWDPVLLSGVNYVNHLALYQRERLLGMGGLREGFQGSQDYDLVLRYTSALAPDEILHLPYPAYIWRHHGSSHSTLFLRTATENARRALAERYRQGAVSPTVGEALSPHLHRIRFDLGKADWPLISIVIVNRDAFPLISKLLDGLRANAVYPALEIVVVDTGSQDARVLNFYEACRQGSTPFVVVTEPGPLNAAHAWNSGVAVSHGRYVLLLSNDIEILDLDWLKEMASCFDYPDVGVVGAKLLYPNRRLQHAGIIIGLHGDSAGGRWFAGSDEDVSGPMGRLFVRQSLSAVSGACMLVSRECLMRTGPFDEVSLPADGMDVDFCLRARAEGYRVIWTPFATLIRRAAARDEAPEPTGRGDGGAEDRAFSPWYSKDRAEPVPIPLRRLPSAR